MPEEHVNNSLREKVEEAARKIDTKIHEYADIPDIPLLREKVRFLVTAIVLSVYGGGLGVIFFVLAVRIIFDDNSNGDITNLFEVMKIFVLPVVTLVLGYYFGAHSRE